MDAELPLHLDRLRDRSEIKVALLRFDPQRTDAVRFDRAPKNSLYWPPVEALAARLLSAGQGESVVESVEVYGRPGWLLAAPLTPHPGAPYFVALCSADGAPVDQLLWLLNDVNHNYWYGSYFWK